MTAQTWAWIGAALALIVFFASHALLVRPALREPVERRIGARGFTWAYSLVSLGLLAWVVAAVNAAPRVPLWPWAPWQSHLALALVLGGLIVLCLGVGRPNPLSFGGARNAAFDPARPGVIGWVRHPVLAALGLWSAGHLIANGDLAHVVLFGSFLGFSLAGMRMIDRRKRRRMGEAEWRRLARGPRRVTPTAAGMLRVVAALALYGALILAHGPVIGAYPIP